MIKRLDPIEDEALLRQAFAWTAECPQWQVDMDIVFGPSDVEDFLRMVVEPENVLVGIFSPEFVGLIIVASAGKDVFNSHLCAKRGSDLGVLAQGAYQVTQDFLKMGMQEGFCFVAERNLAIRNLCDTIGFKWEGVVMYRGAYRGRLIKWLKYSIRPEAKQLEIAA